MEEMSKYQKLWEYILSSGKSEIVLSFEDVKRIYGIEIDHSFLRYKKELNDFGYEVNKISLKNKTICFNKVVYEGECKIKYIVLLRGINISGKNKIAMLALKSVLEGNGFKNVATVLNSGNVILETYVTSKEILGQMVFDVIKENFQLEIPVYITTQNEIEEVLKNSPEWWGTSDKNVYDNLIFIIPPATFDEIYTTVGEPSKDIDKIKEYKNHIFWSFDLKNYRKSNWWIKTASTNIKDKITIRTANTMKKVLDMCKN